MKTAGLQWLLKNIGYGYFVGPTRSYGEPRDSVIETVSNLIAFLLEAEQHNKGIGISKIMPHP
jgi:hypothetical protein